MRWLVAATALACGFLSHTAAPRIVHITVGRADAATGFVAAPGRVVTVAHVLGGGAVRVDGRAATIVRRDERLDLAVLSVPGVDGPRARYGGDSTLVIRRAQARVDGSPLRRAVLELRTEVRPGDSGTPVLTSDGRVAGVIFARSTVRQGVAWAVETRRSRNSLLSASTSPSNDPTRSASAR